MSRAYFDDACPGCRPAMVDVKTGSVFADDSPEMMSETSPVERRAWHRFTCQSSHALADVQLAKAFADRVEAAFADVAKKRERC